jgi:hypothetical protein
MLKSLIGGPEQSLCSYKNVHHVLRVFENVTTKHSGGGLCRPSAATWLESESRLADRP